MYCQIIYVDTTFMFDTFDPSFSLICLFLYFDIFVREIIEFFFSICVQCQKNVPHNALQCLLVERVSLRDNRILDTMYFVAVFIV